MSKMDDLVQSLASDLYSAAEANLSSEEIYEIIKKKYVCSIFLSNTELKLTIKEYNKSRVNLEETCKKILGAVDFLMSNPKTVVE